MDGTLGTGCPLAGFGPSDLLDLLSFAFTCIDADGFAQDITWLDPLFRILMLITPSLYSLYAFLVLFLISTVLRVLYPYTPCRNKIAVIFWFYATLPSASFLPRELCFALPFSDCRFSLVVAALWRLLVSTSFAPTSSYPRNPHHNRFNKTHCHHR